MDEMLIRLLDEEKTEQARDLLEEANIPVRTEQNGETLLYVAPENAERAEAVLKSAGLITDSDPEEPAPTGRKRSIVLTVMMLLLVALAVYGTDAIVEIFRRLFA